MVTKFEVRPLADGDREQVQELLAETLARMSAAVTMVREATMVELAELSAEICSSQCGFGAFRDAQLVAYVSFEDVRDDAQQGSPLAWSPLGHSAATEIAAFERVLQAALDQLANRGVETITICQPRSEMDVADALRLYGFGVRFADAIARVDAVQEVTAPDGLTFAEGGQDDLPAVFPLWWGLVEHLRAAPAFVALTGWEEAEFVARYLKPGERLFLVHDGAEAVGFFRVSPDGEHVLTIADDMANITGAFLKAEYRGGTTADWFVSQTAQVLAAEGIRRLGVDYETMNPTARHFWERTFTPYTWSLSRRLDRGELSRRQSL